jgi:Nif-specific regulatory protein
MPRGRSVIATPKGERRDAPLVPLSEIALTGIYEISKILTAPNRLESTLSGVLNVLSSFLQMRHVAISLLRDDDIPGIVVGADWSEEGEEKTYALPEKAVGQIVATAMPLVVENVASHPLFDRSDAEALGALEGNLVSFIGVPIRVQSRVVGTITIDRVWDGQSFFGFDADVRFLTMVANLIGQTVQLHRVVARDRERLIAESHRLQKEISDLKPERAAKKPNVGGIIGDSPAIRDLIKKILVVARTHSPVLLRGESGTGKELIAKAIHESSPRASGPFIKVNCAALPETVLESELFGHEKGAFTGAISARKGRFELADKGTLFLDEIGEISPAFQAKLLRVLQEQEFERVGGNKTIKVDVRIVAATNKNLEEAVARNEFRADLYYRINVVTLQPPPLRDRRSDIPMLAGEFLSRFNSENDRHLSFGTGALDVLTSCYFPGNVRELENCVRRTATLASGMSIVRDDFACLHDQCLSAVLWNGNCVPAKNPRPQIPLPVYSPPGALGTRTSHRGGETAPLAPSRPGDPAGSDSPLPQGEPGSERERLIEAMEKAGWVQAKAARLLGLTPRQVGYALKKHDIELRRF